MLCRSSDKGVRDAVCEFAVVSALNLVSGAYVTQAQPLRLREQFPAFKFSEHVLRDRVVCFCLRYSI